MQSSFIQLFFTKGQGFAGSYFKYNNEQEPIIAEIYITPDFGSFCLLSVLDISFCFSPS